MLARILSLPTLWWSRFSQARGRTKVAWGCLPVVVLLVCCGMAQAIGQPSAESTAAPTSAPAPVAQADTPVPTSAPTVEPTATTPPEPTPTPAPVATLSPEDALLVVVKDAFGPVIREQGQPGGAWKVEIMNLGSGPEAYVTMPLNYALSNEQFVRQAKRTIARVMNAVYVADPSLVRVGVVGTFPLGDVELPAVSMFAKQDAATWGQVSADELEQVADNVDIKPRYQ